MQKPAPHASPTLFGLQRNSAHPPDRSRT